MANKLLFLPLFFILNSSFDSLPAQTGPGKLNIMKIKYSTSTVSSKMVEILKAQIKDPQKYADLLQKISNVKMYHTLYIDIKNNESVYKLDSITGISSNVHIAGNTSYCYKNSKNAFKGKEIFANTPYTYTGQVSQLKWQIEKETKEIGKYRCQRAILKNSPDIVVWFTAELPVSYGPEYYYGLPGLVLESDSYFELCSISNISYSNDIQEFKSIMNSVSKDDKNEKVLTLQEVINSKNRFINMAEAKMNKAKM